MPLTGKNNTTNTRKLRSDRKENSDNLFFKLPEYEKAQDTVENAQKVLGTVDALRQQLQETRRKMGFQ